MNEEQSPVAIILREIALMEMSLAKVQVEAGMDMPMKVVVITDGGTAIMRDDMADRDEIVSHVNRTIDKGVANAIVTVCMAESIEVSRSYVDELHRSVGLDFSDSPEFVRLTEEEGTLVVTATVQYKWDDDPVTISLVSPVVDNGLGKKTLGETEAYKFHGSDSGHTPCHGLLFNTGNLNPWTEKD